MMPLWWYSPVHGLARRTGKALPRSRGAWNIRPFLIPLIATLLSSSAVSAQTPGSVQASLLRFALALEGPFGDEGPQAQAALEAMSRAVVEWDRQIQSLEVRAAASTGSGEKSNVYEELGRQYMARGRVTDAIGALETAASSDPARAHVHLLRGLAYESARRANEAGAAYHAGWRADRTDPVAAYLMLQRSGGSASSTDRQQALDVLVAISRSGPARTMPAAPFPSFASGSHADFNVPLSLPAAYSRGYALMRAGDYENAISLFRAAATADPLMTDPARALPSFVEGLAALRQGRLVTARERFEAAIASLPDSSEAHRLLGIVLWSAQEVDASLAEFASAVRLRPTDERSRIMLARLLLQSGQLSKAETALHEAIAALPQSTYARSWLGSVYATLKRETDAARSYEAALPNIVAGRPRLYAAISLLRESADDLDGSSATLLESLRLSPNDAFVHLSLARGYQAQDAPEQMFAEFVAALLVDRDNPDAYMGIGQLHLDAGRYEDAMLVLRRLVALSPNFVEGRYALATALLRSGNTGDGDRELAEFRRLQLQQLEGRRRSMALGSLRGEARLQAAAGALDRAIALWQQVIEQEPRLPSNYAELAAVLVDAGRLDDAARQYEQAAAFGGPPGIYNQLARIYERLGRPEDVARASARYEQSLLTLSGKPASQ